jgi:hypothetical protein
MATSQSTMDFILDQLRDVQSIRARKMFGEYALYCGDKVVALVCAEGIAYAGAKPSLLVSADDLEDDERLCELIRVTAEALPPPKAKKPKPEKPKNIDRAPSRRR